MQHQGIPFCLGRPFDLSGMGGPDSSYSTACLALRIIIIIIIIITSTTTITSCNWFVSQWQ